jgi:hypothetical protein
MKIHVGQWASALALFLCLGHQSVAAQYNLTGIADAQADMLRVLQHSVVVATSTLESYRKGTLQHSVSSSSTLTFNYPSYRVEKYTSSMSEPPPEVFFRDGNTLDHLYFNTQTQAAVRGKSTHLPAKADPLDGTFPWPLLWVVASPHHSLSGILGGHLDVLDEQLLSAAWQDFQVAPGPTPYSLLLRGRLLEQSGISLRLEATCNKTNLGVLQQASLWTTEIGSQAREQVETENWRPFDLATSVTLPTKVVYSIIGDKGELLFRRTNSILLVRAPSQLEVAGITDIPTYAKDYVVFDSDLRPLRNGEFHRHGKFNGP